MALLHHPDRNPNDAAATAKFQLIQAAHETLSDPSKRSRYDSLTAPHGRPSPPPGRPAPQPAQPAPQPPPAPQLAQPAPQPPPAPAPALPPPNAPFRSFFHDKIDEDDVEDSDDDVHPDDYHYEKADQGEYDNHHEYHFNPTYRHLAKKYGKPLADMLWSNRWKEEWTTRDQQMRDRVHRLRHEAYERKHPGNTDPPKRRPRSNSEAERDEAEQTTEAERIEQEKLWKKQRVPAAGDGDMSESDDSDMSESEKQRTCLHATFCPPEEPVPRETACGACRQRRSAVLSWCPFCKLKICRLCHMKFNQQRKW